MTLEERYKLHILPEFVYTEFRKAYERFKKKQEEKDERKAIPEGGK